MWNSALQLISSKIWKEKAVKGTFYVQELVRERDTGVYFVKIIKKKKINGKVKYLVSWPEYPDASLEGKTKAELQKIVYLPPTLVRFNDFW